MQCIAYPPVLYEKWRSIMEGLEQASLPAGEPNAESFEDLLAHTFCDLPDAVKQETLLPITQQKDSTVPVASRSDVELKRDAVPGSNAQTAGLSGQQASHPSSGTCSEHGASSGVNEPEHSGRGRGRGRKSNRAAGQQETAQQRAHRRFYERKKAKMAALEQEFADKQAEYQRLLCENTELKRKHDALEWTIAGRDEHMSLLQALSSLSLHSPGLSRSQQTAQQTAQHSAGARFYSEVPRPPAPRPSSVAGSHRSSMQGTGATNALLPPSGLQDRTLAAQSYQLPEHHDLARRYEGVGPFGMVQLRAHSDSITMPPPPPSLAFQQQQQRQWQDGTDSQQPGQWQPQQQVEISHDALHLQRSISMPARASTGDAATNPSHPLMPGHPVSAAAAASSAAQMHRSEGNSPHAWNNVGHATSSRQPGVFTADEHTYANQQVPAQHRVSTHGSSSSSHLAVTTGWAMGPSRLQQVSTQQQLPPALQGQVMRPSSWSSPSSPSSGIPAAPAPALVPAMLHPREPYPEPPPQQQQQQQRQYFRSLSMPGMSSGGNIAASHDAVTGMEGGNTMKGGWMQGSSDSRGVSGGVDARPVGYGMFHTITTAGPLPAAQMPVQRSGSDPTANASRWCTSAVQQQQTIWQDPLPQWLQQQQEGWQPAQQQDGRPVSSGMAAGQQDPSFLDPLLQAPGTQQQTLLPEQQLQQQLEQLYNMQPMPPTEDELMMIDDDLMLLLEQSLTEQDFLAMQTSADMQLSPLPSIPSSSGAEAAAALAAAGLTTSEDAATAAESPAVADSGLHSQPATASDVRQTGPVSNQAAAAAAAALPPHPHPPPAPVRRSGNSHHSSGSGSVRRSGDSRHSTGSGSMYVNFLHASEQLQARHKAAGFFPPTAGPAEFFYLHHMVDWYRGKIQQMSALLPLVDCAVPDVSAGCMLVQVVEETIMGMRKFSTRNRVGIWQLKLFDLDTGEMAEAPISHWKSVLAQLSMTSAQREQPVACYKLLQDHMEKCKQERVAILQQFRDLETKLTGSCGSGVPGSRSSDAGAGPSIGLGAAAGLGVPFRPGSISPDPATAARSEATRQRYVCPNTLQFRRDGLDEYGELLEKLQVSMLREHMIANMLMYSIVQVVSHAQMAKGMVASYPYWPNGSAIMLLMQEEEAVAAARQERLPRTWMEGGRLGRMGSI